MGSINLPLSLAVIARVSQHAERIIITGVSLTPSIMRYDLVSESLANGMRNEGCGVDGVKTVRRPIGHQLSFDTVRRKVVGEEILALGRPPTL